MSPKPFESRIQDLVYNVDVGIGLRLIKSILYLLMVLFIMLMYTATQFRGLKEPEAMDCAQIARNLVYHKQFLTQCIRPASMWMLIEKSSRKDPLIERHPDILHPPLYPLLLAGAFKLSGNAFTGESAGIFRPEQWVVVPLGHLFTLLTAAFVFLLGRRLFDQKVAWLGVLVFVLSDAVWRTSISGLSLTFLTFLVTVALYTAVKAVNLNQQEGSGWRWIVPYVVSLVAAILAFLTRYGACVLVPGLALFYGFSLRRNRWAWATAFVLVFLAGISPWLVRNQLVSGGLLGLAPYMALSDSGAFEGDTFERTLAPTIALGRVVGPLQTKWMTNMAGFYRGPLRTLGDGLLICLFLTTFFYRFVRQHVHLLRWSIALSALLLLAVAGFFGDVTVRLLYVFWPVVILYGLAFFSLLLERMQLQVRLFNMGVTVLFVFLCAVPLIFSLLPPRAGVPYPPYFPPYIFHVCKLLEPRELLCTDMPWATAWYGDRSSLALPVTVDEFYEINDYNKRISGLYFTTLTRNLPYVRSLVTGSYRTWLPILEGRVPGDFPLTEGFPLGNFDQLFLTDRARWTE